MPARPLSDDLARQAAEAYAAANNVTAHAARALDIPVQTLQNRLKRAAERGFLGTRPVLPGFEITKTTAALDEQGRLLREYVQQKPERGEVFEMPEGHVLKGVSAFLDADGREIAKWVKTKEDAVAQAAAMRAVVDGFKDELPRAEPVAAPAHTDSDLLNQYTVTDLHFGMLAWKKESGADYDLKIAEQLLVDWFAAAIALSADASTAVLAQIGDLLHYDSHQSETPTHRHVLDSDSRFQKMVHVVIRALRRIIRMLLEKHERLHIVMADANHDPASGAWLREMFAAFYDDEPRITVDSSPSTYYAYRHGETSLFYHHGHKRKIASVDGVFAGKFREMYGQTKYSYAHIGHLHADELKSTNLMKVEQHETLAAPDAFAANGGWLSGRSAKVITYSKQFGEVGRITITPAMVESIRRAR